MNGKNLAEYAFAPFHSARGMLRFRSTPFRSPLYNKAAPRSASRSLRSRQRRTRCMRNPFPASRRVGTVAYTAAHYMKYTFIFSANA